MYCFHRHRPNTHLGVVAQRSIWIQWPSTVYFQPRRFHAFTSIMFASMRTSPFEHEYFILISSSTGLTFVMPLQSRNGGMVPEVAHCTRGCFSGYHYGPLVSFSAGYVTPKLYNRIHECALLFYKYSYKPPRSTNEVWSLQPATASQSHSEFLFSICVGWYSPLACFREGSDFLRWHEYMVVLPESAVAAADMIFMFFSSRLSYRRQ